MKYFFPLKKVLFLFFPFIFLVISNVSSETIQFSADSMTGTAGDTSDTTTLSGHAFVKTESMEITADTIELKGDNFRYIFATGTVTGKNSESQMDFTCGRMKYDRVTKIARLENTVNLIDIKNNVTADAQIIEYNQKTEIAVLQIEVTLKQKDNVCTSAYAVYRKDAQMLEMSGNPKIIQGKDTFRAQEITLNLNTQAITLDGRVSGSVTDSNNNDTPATPEASTDTSLPDATSSDTPPDNNENEGQTHD